MKIIATSGYFDPLHIGHIRLFKESKKLGDKLVVLLDGDVSAVKKKGKVFMPQDERKEIIENLSCVDEVIIHNNTAEALDKLKPDVFTKGGDKRSFSDLPMSEKKVAEKNKIQVIFLVGGDKVQSSSWLLKNYGL